MAGLSSDEASWSATCLEALQVFDRDGTRLRVEPVLHAALGVRDALTSRVGLGLRLAPLTLARTYAGVLISSGMMPTVTWRVV
ncbi:hypothetical protein GCM10023083_20860 [Streptomyces phyllanthi]